MKPSKFSHPAPTEREEMITFVDFLEIQKNLGNVLAFTHIPNSTFTKSWKQKMTNWKMGLRKGFPDMLIITATGHLVAVEMKRIRGGQVSEEQREWIAALKKCAPSVHAKICKGAMKAIEFVEEYLPYRGNLKEF